MAKERINLGRLGEKIAVTYLKTNGYAILERNFSSPLGEIDIIAKDGEATVFIEVRTRRTDEYGLPIESIGKDKQRRLIRTAWFYIKGRNFPTANFRFDVISILTRQGGKPQISIIKDAFWGD